MKNTRLLLLSTFCVLWLGTTAYAQNVLKVGITPNLPPIAYKEAGKYAGLEADLARKLGKELGRTIEFVDVAWVDQIPSLVEGRTDIIMSGMTITQKRHLQIAFSEPYFIVGQIGLVRAEDQSQYLTINFIKSSKARIGVEKGTTGEMVVRGLLPNRKLSVYETPKQALDALRKKKIDVLIHDSPVVWNVLSKDYKNEFSVPQGALSTEYLGWGIRKTDDQLLTEVNSILTKWKENGELITIIKKWMPFLDALPSNKSGT